MGMVTYERFPCRRLGPPRSVHRERRQPVLREARRWGRLLDLSVIGRRRQHRTHRIQEVAQGESAHLTALV